MHRVQSLVEGQCRAKQTFYSYTAILGIVIYIAILKVHTLHECTIPIHIPFRYLWYMYMSCVWVTHSVVVGIIMVQLQRTGWMKLDRLIRN